MGFQRFVRHSLAPRFLPHRLRVVAHPSRAAVPRKLSHPQALAPAPPVKRRLSYPRRLIALSCGVALLGRQCASTTSQSRCCLRTAFRGLPATLCLHENEVNAASINTFLARCGSRHYPVSAAVLCTLRDAWLALILGVAVRVLRTVDGAHLRHLNRGVADASPSLEYAHRRPQLTVVTVAVSSSALHACNTSCLRFRRRAAYPPRHLPSLHHFF
ncbi:hypothetical protein C8R46DRAFT_1238600 [Mycena filopes]|nr:hypothetical protein C8R46DRAFT_1238598 [Mycena filopes]KAJ7120016.1 hypothetical protein C8R46DRAFT_1238600 [Mycena filopes]